MSWLFNWLLGKSTKQLLNMKKTREAKIAKLTEEIEQIEEMIKRNEA